MSDFLEVIKRKTKKTTFKKNRNRKKTFLSNSEGRSIIVPPNRYTPLKENWTKIYNPIVEHLKLQVRFNLKNRHVELRTSEETTNAGHLQKANDFVTAFILGFSVQDALAILRLDDMYVESFCIHDVKILKGDHLSRCIGRIAGKNGRTRYAIENSTRTRIILADTKIHILGSFANIATARRTISNLIMGTPSSKIYGKLKTMAPTF